MNMNNQNRVGTVLPTQSNRIRVPSTNNTAKNQIAAHMQQLLKQYNNNCFITTKAITVGGTKVPRGTAGKVVNKGGGYHCTFAVPCKSIETIINPITSLEFGLFPNVS